MGGVQELGWGDLSPPDPPVLGSLVQWEAPGASLFSSSHCVRGRHRPPRNSGRQLPSSHGLRVPRLKRRPYQSFLQYLCLNGPIGASGSDPDQSSSDTDLHHLSLCLQPVCCLLLAAITHGCQDLAVVPAPPPASRASPALVSPQGRSLNGPGAPAALVTELWFRSGTAEPAKKQKLFKLGPSLVFFFFFGKGLRLLSCFFNIWLLVSSSDWLLLILTKQNATALSLNVSKPVPTCCQCYW